MTKKAVLINDLSGLGKCSLTAAIAVLSVMGIQPCPMPTAVLTNQTGYKSFFCNDCTDKLDLYTSEWKKLGFDFDGIYTGFLSSEKQADKIFDFIKAFRRENTLVLVDPVMGDGGKTYSLFTDALAQKMKMLISSADVITPNLTECCILCDCDYKEVISHCNESDYINRVTDMGKQLIGRYKIKTVIITGIIAKDKPNGENLIHNIAVSEDYSFDTKSKITGASYSGTGDLFASVVFSSLMRGDSLEGAVQKAVNFIEASLLDTVNSDIDPNDGIEFEKHLDMLL